MASKRKSTLDQINDLLTPAPEIGSDDDLDFDTRAKVVEDFEDDEEETIRQYPLRQSFAFDDDPRYIGKRVSRSRDIEEDSGNDNSDIEPIPVGTFDSKKDYKSSETQESDAEEEVQSDQSDADDESGDHSTDDESEDDEYSLMETSDAKDTSNDFSGLFDSSFQHISSTKSVESEVEKGKAVKSQLSIWDSLLECRIHLQKCLISSNRLPKYNKMHRFMEEGGEEFEVEMKKSQKNVKNLLDKFLELQKILVNNYSETKDLDAKPEKRKCDFDEEISSSSDEDKGGRNKEIKILKKKKITHVEGYECELNENYKQYSEFRDATIQKWNDRTRMITGKASSRDFSAFEQSTLQQIRHVLSNRTRLILRTRVPRSVGTFLGEGETDDSSHPEHDAEIFDDSDFYHQLLRELIERRSEDNQDSAALGRRWAALQKMRIKMKRRIDTKATKGRRLRYDPHQKLVGYMAPIVSPSEWSEKAVNDLFSSLFGKNVQQT